MALKFFDRTKQDATTTGTGTFTLGTSASTGGFRTFASVHTTGDEVFYCAVDNVNNTFEVGQGTLTSGSPNWTLSRDKVKSSSNSNNKVNFATAPEIFSTYPAENAAFSDTTLSNNVVETDAVFDETLTDNKALSGQFKGTLQFNKAFFTITDYTVASGQTLTVTDSADLYAVDITAGTVMDRTADFTDDVTISSNTMFSPGINAYATVTIANGVKATVSPVGTTFANNGAGITTGGPISWKLPTSDGAANTEIVTDGKGGFAIKGAIVSDGGVPVLVPSTEVLVSTFDFNAYTPSSPLESLEVVVPKSIASNVDFIESFRIKWVGVNFGGADNANNNASTVIYSIAPISSAGGDVIFSSTDAQWQSYGTYQGSTTSWQGAQGFTSGKDRTWTVSNGTYDSNTYGYALWGYQSAPSMSSRGSSSYYGPTIASNPFTSSENNYMRTNVTGEVQIMNNQYSMDTQQTFQWNGYSGNYGFDQYNYWGGGRPQQNSNNTVYNSQTGRARGFRMYFLPYDKNNQGSWGLVSGRIEVFTTLKQDAAQITVA